MNEPTQRQGAEQELTGLREAIALIDQVRVQAIQVGAVLKEAADAMHPSWGAERYGEHFENIPRELSKLGERLRWMKARVHELSERLKGTFNDELLEGEATP